MVRLPTEYCASRLERRHRDLLASLPLSVTLEVTGLGAVRFCHATTRSDTEIVLVDSSMDQYKEAFEGTRSEEHTSELQSPCNLVCRLLLEKKKKKHMRSYTTLSLRTRRHDPL